MADDEVAELQAAGVMNIQRRKNQPECSFHIAGVLERVGLHSERRGADHWGTRGESTACFEASQLLKELWPLLVLEEAIRPRNERIR